MRFPYEAQHCRHVVRDRSIDAPQVHRVPSAIFLGVVPGQKEIGDAARLAGILPRNAEQPFQGEPGGLLSFCG